MPIRFACPHCRQKLTVSSRKAGTSADCPRCKWQLTIPAVVEPATAQPVPVAAPALADSQSADDPEDVATRGEDAHPSPAEAPSPIEPAIPDSPPPPADDPSEPFPTFSWTDDHELVYDTAASEDALPPAVDQQDLVALPRAILYLQGGLLAVVALASFSIGFIAGGTLSGPAPVAEPLACTLSGTIQFSTGGRHLPDEGAVVAVIPQNQLRPDEKAPVGGLRPADPTPDPGHRGLAILRELGGGYARTDSAGHFELKLPDRGQYLVLVISHEREVASIDEISTADILKLGPFFDNAADLLGQQRYELKSEAVRGDRQINVVF